MLLSCDESCLPPSALHVKETEDNEPVVSTMMELHRLLTSKHLPAVQNWVQVSAELEVLLKTHS